MSKANKPPAHHISKVQDAIVQLKAKDLPHYRPDIVALTGLTMRQVNAVLNYWERQAMSNPVGKDRISVTRMAGQTADGGIATTDADIEVGADQRDKSIDSQSVVQANRRRVQYLRKPSNGERAIKWARAERRLGVAEFATARMEIDIAHKEAMRNLLAGGGIDFAEAWQKHYDLMAEIDAL